MIPSEPIASESIPVPNDVLEAYGQTCVGLEPLIKKHIRALPQGGILEVRADDVTARLGVPAWCRISGHALVAVVVEDRGRTRFFVRRK